MKYCITNSLSQFMDEYGLWHDDLKVYCCYCCYSYDYARELQEIYDVYNSTEIKEI